VGGTIVFKDNAVISPQTVYFQGQGLASQLSPSSATIDFGHLLVNTTGLVQYLFFSNSGTAPLQISSVALSGDFIMAQNACLGTFQPGDYCFITVTFSPKAGGVRTGILSIASNDPLHPKATLTLTGVGDTAYPIPLISSLGSPSVQAQNGPMTVTVYGANFYPASVIAINGMAQPTQYFNGQELQATVGAPLNNAIGEVSVTVVNTAPGGGISTAAPLTRYLALHLSAGFLTTVPGSTLLYATIPSSSLVNPNSVVSIDPATLAVSAPIQVGANPGVITASNDGKYLFLAANQDQTVQRINLGTRAVDRTFPFPPNPSCPGCFPQTVSDLKGVPGSPLQFILALQGVMALYNDQGLVNYVPSSSIAFSPEFSSLAFAGTPQAIYSLPFSLVQNSFFNIVTLDAQGLHFAPLTGGNYGGNNTTGAQVVSDGTLLYTSAGEIWNPATKAQVGSFPVTTYNSTSYPNLSNLILDAPGGHLFLLGNENYEQDSSALVLSAYGQKSHLLTGFLGLPQITATLANSLVRWGTNGFAFLGPNADYTGQDVYLLTSSLAGPTGSNPTPVIRSIAPSSVAKGGLGFQLTVNGSGFTVASVIKWNGVALPTSYVTSTILTTVVPPSDIAASGMIPISVTTPAPGGGTSNSVAFTITGGSPQVALTPATLTFDAQTVGTTSAPKPITLQNTGSASLAISTVSFVGTNPASFLQTNNCGTALAAGAQCTISVSFKPVSKGPRTASLTLTDNAAGSPQKAPVNGTGK
jgi:hypothetical protein